MLVPGAILLRRKGWETDPKALWAKLSGILACSKGDDNEAHLQSSVFKLSKDLIDSIHEEGIVAYTS